MCRAVTASHATTSTTYDSVRHRREFRQPVPLTKTQLPNYGGPETACSESAYPDCRKSSYSDSEAA